MRKTIRWSILVGATAFALGCGGDDSGGGGTPDAGNNQPDASLEDVPDLATYLATITVPSVQGSGEQAVPSCCVDFGDRSKNGPGTDDNAFAVLAANPLLAIGGINIQEILDEGLQDGSQVILLNHVGLASADDSFRLDGLVGDFAAGTTYAEASTGAGQFTVRPSSFDGNGDALISMTGTVASSAMTAGPDNFSFAFPLGDIVVDVNISEAQLSGDATIGTDGVSYTNGTIGGYIIIDELFGALNAFGATCTCLGLDGDLFEKNGEGEWEGNCNDQSEELCPDDSNCATVGGGLACDLLPGILQDSADIDLNNNTDIYEGFSIGLQFTGQNASVQQ